ncbi:MAG: thioredoxin domain-containing protein [Beggiatoa sp. IS2]|nr:MAG: thioredoxin domain-containing protein [Beggiatoa sp. IS2]
MTDYTNTLIHETSPYLLQHAHNPVHWYPWGKMALTLAKQQDKPILLSIGYSACHWCHVMAHESFENPETARVMNELFINIKVDREERPDLDKIYQAAHHLLTQRTGGWPLTLFLSADDQFPFFGGTYFPPQPRYGLPAFTDLLKKVAGFYNENRHDIRQQNQALLKTLQQLEIPEVTKENVVITAEPLNWARQQMAQDFDEKFGGFSGAPKFPHLTHIERLFHHYLITQQQGIPDEEALQMAVWTLKKMALGGIYDQLGGGFYRYSTDEQWMIPHFEKMLYDNGQFLDVYSKAWQLTQDPLFQKIALATANWALHDIQSPIGGFYSSLDADSEGEEGKFYVWSKDRVKTLLHDDIYSPFAYHFGLNRVANFEGHWHLHVHHEAEAVAKKFDLTLTEAEARLNEAQHILLQVRAKRVPPGRDEKILTAWNALMIKGLASAGLIFARPDYLVAAERALDFVHNTLWVNGRLLATYKDGKAHINAYLDDYAFLLDAILMLLQARWRDRDCTFAIALAEALLAEFADKKHGGFYFTAHHHETLILRPKSFTDEALPSGNACAAYALGRLGYLLAEPRYLEAAERTIHAAWPNLKQFAASHSTLLLAMEDYLFPPQIIILRGMGDSLKTWQTICQKEYDPRRICLAIPTDATDLPPFLAEKVPQGEMIAYMCSGQQCYAPITNWEELQSVLHTDP